MTTWRFIREFSRLECGSKTCVTERNGVSRVSMDWMRRVQRRNSVRS